MNNQAAGFLGEYAPFYWAICTATHKTIEVDAQDIFDAAVVQPRLTKAQVEVYVNLLWERAPHLNYAQAQKHIFRILGYRSSGLACAIRLKYTQLHQLSELTYPNMWYEFLYVQLQDSVFGMAPYSNDECSLHYLEFIYEPRLRNLLTHDGIPDDLDDAFLTLLNISQQKTMSIPMARTMATQVAHELDNRVCGSTALNLVAIALGYKTWVVAMAQRKDDYIPNLRLPSRFAPLPAEADPWLDIPTSKPVPPKHEARV